MPKPRSAGFRITRVGLSFLIFAFIVLLAASNTGNNGLFLALAVMLATFVVSQVLAAGNVRQLAFSLGAPTEIFAERPAGLELTLENRSRLLSRWLLAAEVNPEDNPEDNLEEKTAEKKTPSPSPLFIPHLRPQQQHRAWVKFTPTRRGRHSIESIQVGSLFPLGFFHKAVHHPVDLEFLVYPATLPPGTSWPTQVGRNGDAPTHRAGWGHDLLSLRGFRHGDDPRSIHWKHSARTGKLIYKEHEAEESRRLLILLDNATGPLENPGDRQHFERMVSEAATAALEYLEQGFQVSLVTRDHTLSFADGGRQRFRILERLALLEPLPKAITPLPHPVDENAPYLRLSMEGNDL